MVHVSRVTAAEGLVFLRETTRVVDVAVCAYIALRQVIGSRVFVLSHRSEPLVPPVLRILGLR